MPSQASSVHNYGYASDPYADDPYQGYSSSTRSVDRRLGEVNPEEIEDDGDDGLRHPKYSQRNSMLSSAAASDRGARPAIGAAAAVGGAAAAGGAVGGLLQRGGESRISGNGMNARREPNANDGCAGGPEYNLAEGTEKRSGGEKDKGMSKKMKWLIIIGAALVIVGAVVGGVVGSMIVNQKKNDNGGTNSGETAEEDREKNGDLSADSDEIKELLNNPDLHKVFPGMDYTPIHVQYPDCLRDPPSQNNITRDIAVMSQLTNKVRLYGTDCNQTEMVLHAIDRLDLKDEVKVWMGVWQDDNETTNARQLEQMWTVLDEYGDEPFEGLIVANEILYRQEMTITTLANLLEEVRSNLTDRNLNLPVATSDLGDDWTDALARASDYIMANIHPFFAGEPAGDAADWVMEFWENNNGQFFKTDKKKNIISETGWPTGGGTNCGAEGVTDCPNGSVAGVDELNEFMEGWVCSALRDGTEYFWFSAFDEPWKVRFNEKGKEWEDKWGLMDVNRNLKEGVKIPDCGGKTVS
jgi:exo-beta-1,3-glucanase (GH17 family)